MSMETHAAERWRPLWREAAAQQIIATDLLGYGHFSAAVFHALQSRELALKAVRAAAPTWGELEHATYGQLENYTYGQLESGLEVDRDHRPVLDAPWMRGYPVEEMDTRIAAIETELGLSNGSLYDACRYPDRWPGESAVPSEQVTADQAREVCSAVDVLLRACRQRFEASSVSDP